MHQFINLDNSELRLPVYRTTLGLEIGIEIDNKKYLIKNTYKKPLILKIHDDIKYSTYPMQQYIGMKIFELLDIPVFKVMFAVRDKYLVLIREDFRDEFLFSEEFKKFKITTTLKLLDDDGDVTDFNCQDLSTTLQVIREHHILKTLDFDIENFFWKIWIVDFIINNTVRSDLDWGFSRNSSDYELVGITPIHDCGNCLQSEYIDEHQLEVIESGEYPKCTEALAQLIPKMNKMDYETLIDSLDFLSDKQNILYKTIIKTRIALLNKIYEDLT